MAQRYPGARLESASHPSQPIAVEGDAKSALMLSSVDRDKADVEAVWLDPCTLTPEAHSVNYLRSACAPITTEAATKVS
jgi:hypothetical protein